MRAVGQNSDPGFCDPIQQKTNPRAGYTKERKEEHQRCAQQQRRQKGGKHHVSYPGGKR